MKIVHLETGRHLYGGALQVLLLIEGLRVRGVDGLLVVPPGSGPARAAEEAGLKIRPVPIRGEADLLFGLRFLRILREERPDLVHLHSRRGADTLGGLAAWWSGIPAVLSRRVDNPEPAWLAGIKYRLFARVVAISGAIRTVLAERGVPADKIRVVHSALDPLPWEGPCRREKFRAAFGIPPNVPVVGMAAQFIPRKGHDVLLRALPAVFARHPDTRVLLFGQGPLQDRVAERIRQAGWQDQVLLPGYRDDLAESLPCLDVLVHPATREGLGIILLQAAAARVPVVATAVGGIPEVVEHGETGFLIPPGDFQALAERTVFLLDHPEEARRLGERARRRVESEFSVDRMVEGNLAVYREVLGQENQGARRRTAR